MPVLRNCQRCGVHEHDTEEGFLALNGDKLVCSDCNDYLDAEFYRDEPDLHPTNALHYSVSVFG
jgi:hypothetical protein